MLWNLRWLAAVAGICTVAAVGIIGIPARADSARVPGAEVRATVAGGSCPNFFAVAQWVCAWKRNGFRGTRWEFDSGMSSFSSLGKANDRGVSIAALGPYRAIRIYRDTDFFGAWVCIPLRRGGVRWISNLGHYVFNNGAGLAGYGQAVARNFKSIGFSSSACTNPA